MKLAHPFQMKSPYQPTGININRLDEGGLIDRSRPLNFTFDGRSYTGFAGDTLAAALIANNVRLVGRSFKYHRPRGVLTAGSEEPNALVTLRSGARAEPNTRATTVPLFDNLVATSQNRWPSLAIDMMAVNQLASPLFVAGFYYKTFMWPAKFWEKLYEPVIRRAAGLGKLSMLPDPDTYDRDHAFCDLLIVGGGAAGLAAALAAGRLGLRVVIVDEGTAIGGGLLSLRSEIDGKAPEEWVGATIAELASLDNVLLLARTNVFGVYDGCEYGAVERVSDHLLVPEPGQPRQRLWKIVAKRAILATGAIERPLVFSGNDRPGVMMASAVSTYLNRFAVMPGSVAVIVTSTDSGWATAEDLLRSGVKVSAIVETRMSAPPASTLVVSSGTRIFLGAAVTEAHGRRLEEVSIRDSNGQMHKIACDLVAMAGGWNPAIGLASNLGARPVWCPRINSFLMGEAPKGLVASGAAAGLFGVDHAVLDGYAQATAIARNFGFAGALPPPPVVQREPSAVSAHWEVGAGRGKAFVDFQHDVTSADIEIAAREGFVSVEHLKRYTTLGMATDQGKTSQLNGHAILAAATGKSVSEAGTIASRPPYSPVAIGVLAGHHRDEHFRPTRYTASHQWAAERGATFVDTGQWKRAQWFTQSGDMGWLDSVNREVRATRGRVGICDVSTLGKIDVHGPDAGKLLDLLYINMFSTLPVGKARYGVMLREDGFVMDDGTTTRFADDYYFMTTTTANATRVMQHIDYARQVLWPDLDVQATSVTEQWSTYAVAGPLSRALLNSAFAELDLSNDAMPYMGAGQYKWGKIPLRIYRLSFSGEMAFEVSVPAEHGLLLCRHLFEVGTAFDVEPYGTEALGVMRIEKGHPAGNELNGQTTAADLGMGRMMSKKKDFIGRVMAQRPGLVAVNRSTLVGLVPVNGSDILRAGAHLLPAGARPVAANDQGYVTSAAFSPTLGHSIALALLANGPARHGEMVVVHDPVRGKDVDARVCNPVFVDPDGERVRG
ncbi:sarcosine oxidase subunit alpha [soil metagenome]